MDDQAAIARVLAGDTDAFRILVQRYQRPLWSFLGNLLRDRHECEDLVQDVFLAAYANLHRYNPQAPPSRLGCTPLRATAASTSASGAGRPPVTCCPSLPTPGRRI